MQLVCLAYVDVVWCSLVYFGVALCSLEQFGTVWHSLAQFGTVWCNHDSGARGAEPHSYTK